MSWISDVRDEIQDLNLSGKNLRKFGLFVGGIFLLIGLYMEYRHVVSEWRFVLFGVGAMLMALGAVYPRSLTYVYRFWMGIAFTVGWLVSRVLLAVIFYGIVTPIGLVMKLFGKNPIEGHLDPEAESHWVMKDESAWSIERYKKMY
ncbi:hypothetical protein JXO52_17530 [bacterium]|nr:hypothetical protein [bacterium]